MKILFTGVLCLAVLTILLPARLAAQTETVLHAFGAPKTPHDGSLPSAPLILGADGNYYGTTPSGGTSGPAGYINGNGTVFKMTPSGSVTVLHSFQDGTVDDDGAEPLGGLVQGLDGNFYGTTCSGGSTKTVDFAGYGTLFRMTPQGVVTILHDFGDGTVVADGINPKSTLMMGIDGALYGTTTTGGAGTNGGGGTVFKATLVGKITILHSFDNEGYSAEGTLPLDIIQGTDANFYGTTSRGGLGGSGTVFKMNSEGTVTVLHQFQIQSPVYDGASPTGRLVEGTDGEFYGTTASGTGANGTIFKITPSGRITILYFFNTPSWSDGVSPIGGLVQDGNGHFWGTTYRGGANQGGGLGTIFQITEEGVLTTLHLFAGSDPNDGQYPEAALVLTPQGNLIGTTFGGGAAAVGTVFQITASGAYTILHSFQERALQDGQNPTQGLVAGPGGFFYGTATSAFFKISPQADFALIPQLPPASAHPVLYQAGMVLDADGNFYGIGSFGSGSGGAGGVFKTTPDGIDTLLHSFFVDPFSPDGLSPRGGLTLGPDGKYYGTLAAGGSAGGGSIFSVTKQGVVSILHDFGDGTVAGDGLEPHGKLILASDGCLYGTTYRGGANPQNPSGGYGTAFKITMEGSLTILHRFADGSVLHDGWAPEAGLIQASDGNFYGTTYGGGIYAIGTIFKMTKAGVVTILHSFTGGLDMDDGARPKAPLIELADGNLGGTSSVIQSGTKGGSVFEITPSGVLTLLHVFDGSSPEDGLNPVGALLEDSSAALLGVTNLGGTGSMGTIYRIAKAAQTLNFPPIPSHPPTDAPFALTASASSGLPVRFRVLSGPATISGQTLTLTSTTGRVVVEARQAGSPAWAPATATQSFAISTKASQTITFPTISSQPVGARVTLNATASSALAVHYLATGPATLSGRILTVTGVGKITLRASQPGSSGFLPAAEVVQSFDGIKAAQKITFPAISSQTWPVSTLALSATASSGLPVTYAVSGGATVSGSTLTITKPGTVNVTARQLGGTLYGAAPQVTIQFNVAKVPQTLTFPAIGRVAVGTTLTLGATTSSGLPVAYALASGVATLSGNTVTFNKVGTVKITATQPGDAFTAAAKAVSINIAVK